MTATGLGSTLQDSRDTLDVIAGVVIVALGVLFVITPFVPRLNREWRPDALISRAGSGGPLVAGAAFAFAWTPCVGPTLGAILTAASVKGTVGEGALLLACYSAGLAVPFMLTAVAFNRATAASRWLRDRWTIVTARLGRRADRDGRAAAHGRADAPQRRGAAGAGLDRPERLQGPLILVLDIGSSSVRASRWDETAAPLGEPARIEQERTAGARRRRAARARRAACSTAPARTTSPPWPPRRCGTACSASTPTAARSRPSTPTPTRARPPTPPRCASASTRPRSTPAPAAACTRATGRRSSPGCATPSRRRSPACAPGSRPASTSSAACSATPPPASRWPRAPGMLDQRTCDWDRELAAELGVEDALPPIDDAPRSGLRGEWARALAGAARRPVVPGLGRRRGLEPRRGLRHARARGADGRHERRAAGARPRRGARAAARAVVLPRRRASGSCSAARCRTAAASSRGCAASRSSPRPTRPSARSRRWRPTPTG